MEEFADLKKPQAALAAKVSDLAVRLENVESIVENLDGLPAATEIQRTVSEAGNAQSAEFSSRLNELEQRRDNLIFMESLTIHLRPERNLRVTSGVFDFVFLNLSYPKERFPEHIG